MLALNNVTKQYQIGQSVWELKNINLTISTGECISITGASGSGKSTLLHLMGGLDKPHSGSIVYNKKTLSEMSDAVLSQFRNKTIGFVFQEFFLYPDINLVDNVALPLMIAREKASTRTKKALKALEEVGLAGLEDHSMTEISGGQRQRVAIARAIVHKPKILLADEPTGNLDSQTGTHILALLQSLQKKHNMTMIMVTHDPKVAQYTQRNIHITDGCITHDVAQ